MKCTQFHPETPRRTKDCFVEFHLMATYNGGRQPGYMMVFIAGFGDRAGEMHPVSSHAAVARQCELSRTWRSTYPSSWNWTKSGCLMLCAGEMHPVLPHAAVARQRGRGRPRHSLKPQHTTTDVCDQAGFCDRAGEVHPVPSHAAMARQRGRGRRCQRLGPQHTAADLQHQNLHAR